MSTRTAERGASSFVTSLGSVVLLCGDVFRSLFTVRLHWDEFIKQLHFIGWKSQVIVLTTGASTGMVFTPDGNAVALSPSSVGRAPAPPELNANTSARTADLGA